MLQLAGPIDILPGVQLWLHDATAMSARDEDRLTAERLSDCDRRRFERYRTADKRRQFVVSRLVLSDILRKLIGLSDGFSVVATRSGRPIVVDENGEEIVSISLSHSGNITAVATSRTMRRVGVDIEVRAPLNQPALVPMILSQDEQTWFRVIPPTRQEETLRQIWTVKESVWKCHGEDCHTRVLDIHVNRNGEITTRRHCAGFATETGQSVQTFTNFPCDVLPGIRNLREITGFSTHIQGSVATSDCMCFVDLPNEIPVSDHQAGNTGPAVC
ncbi:MAG: 4'-phosphopantetheinyl transferase superfamily protein [Planctomycetaceae bacterium]